MKVSLIGTGLMGNPMALRLKKYGILYGAFNRSREKTLNLAENGIFIYSDLKDLFRDNDVVLLILSDYSAVKEVLFGEELQFNGKTIIQMSTIAPAENIELAEKVLSEGGKYLEAPVLGSIPQVKEGKLILMVSGGREEFNRQENIFKILGNHIYYLNEYGKASSLKLALNQLIASLTAAFSMSLGFVRENNVNVDVFMEILRKSALYAPTFDKKLTRMLERNFENPNFPLKHLLKDVNLMISSFEKNNLNVAPLKGVQKILESGIKNGLSEFDYSALYNEIHKTP